jgi:hypothetical protein
MTLASIQAAISYRSLLLIPVAVTAGMVLLVRAMRKLGLRPQFMVLLILGVSSGFIFLVMVQMPEFPQWLGVTLLLIVLIASFFGVRIFLRAWRWRKRTKTTRFALKTLTRRSIGSFQT